jgi:heme A synthase
MALITAGYAWWTLRASHPRMVAWCMTLFVSTLAQTGIGHWITDDGHDWLIGVHVPLAFIIFRLTTWISTRAIRLTRRDSR